MMKKILLVYPEIASAGGFDRLPPLSLLYVATPLRQEFDVRIIDQRVDKEWRRTLHNELAPGGVLCVGISTMTGPQILGALRAAEIVRATSPNVPIVWGGVHPSLLPEQTARHRLVDMVVVGDGEETFRELVLALQGNGDYREVAGIVRQEDGALVKTDRRNSCSMDRVAPPAYDLINVRKYLVTPPWGNGPCLPLITSRGCPHRCGYCYNTEFSHRRWTSLSAEQTVQAMADLRSRYAVSGVYLLDDNFFVDLGRVRRICELMLETRSQVEVYNANCRIDTIVRMDAEILHLLKRAGFHQLYVGVESGSDRILERIGKEITVAQVLEAADKLASCGIQPVFSFMAGFPFETVEDVQQTLTLMKRLADQNPMAVIYKIQLFTPFPGTRLYHECLEQGMALPDALEGWAGFHYDRLNCDGFSPRHRKFLTDISYYSGFLDGKVMSTYSRYLKRIAPLYARLLRLRISRRFYGCLYEHYPVRCAQRLRARLSARRSACSSTDRS